MNTKTRQKRGFTIVELVVVIAVIAVLASVLIPVFADLVDKAYTSADTTATKNLNTVLSTAVLADGEITGVSDVRKFLDEAGYNSDDLKPMMSGYAYYWYSKDNTIMLVSDTQKVVFPEEYKDKSLTDFEVGTMFNLAELPAAEVKEIEVTLNPSMIHTGWSNTTLDSALEIDAALQFTALHTPEEAVKLEYANWIVDYIITVDQSLNVPGSRYFLAGQYGEFDERWVLLEFTGAELEEGQETMSVRLLKDLLFSDATEGGLTYQTICEFIREFNCGVAVEGDANGLGITVELVMYENESDYHAYSDNYEVVCTYRYTFD